MDSSGVSSPMTVPETSDGTRALPAHSSVTGAKRRASEDGPAATKHARAGGDDTVASGAGAGDASMPAAAPNQTNGVKEELLEDELDQPASDVEVEMEHAVIVPKRAPQLRFFGKKTGIAYDVRMRYHSRAILDPMAYIDPHPEDPRRTFRIYRAIAEAGLIEDETLQGVEQLGDLMHKIKSREATEDELLMVHAEKMIEFIKESAGFDMQTLQYWTENGDSIYLNNDSNEAARLSAGGAIEACRAVVEGAVKNAIAVVRPPGHHAEPQAPGGFCLFGNVAIASEVMLKQYPEQVKKVFIFDWDVHHGNGTQRSFLGDDRVLYMSIHRYDGGSFYPGTKFGGADVVGEGKGEGYTVNIPWPSGGMGDGDYITAFRKVVMPIAAEFDPDLVIVSAGFDAAEGDPIGGCHVSPHGYQHMLHELMSLAEGKVVVTLEGGYNLESISSSALAITKILLGDPPGKLQTSLPSNTALEVFSEVQAIQSRYWKSMGPPTIKFEPEIEAYTQQQQKLSEEASHAREGERTRDQNGSSTSTSTKSEEANGESGEPGGTGTLSHVTASQSGPSSEVMTKQSSKSNVSVLNSLLDVVRGFERHELSSNYEFAPLPLLRGPTLDSEILATPDIYSQERVLIFFHGPSLVWAHRDPVTGRIRPDESVVANPAIQYIKWAVERGYGVVDIFLSPLEKTTPAKLVATIAENTIKFFKSRKIVVLGAGQAYGYAVQTVANREMKDRLTAIVCFVGPEDTLRQFPSSSDEAAARRFHDHSLVFVSAKHHTWNQKYARKKCGRLIKADGENLYSVMRQNFKEATEYVNEEEELADEESESDSE